MTELCSAIAALIAGFLLGATFFGGLWWPIRMGISSELPAVWFSASFLLRTTVAVGGFYFVSHGDWGRLLVCLGGFVLARIVVTRLTRSPMEKRSRFIEAGIP
jgi:F1F0 ATPase subunit 2